MDRLSDLCQNIYSLRPWDETLAASLKECAEPKKAWQNLTTLAGQTNFQELFPGFFPSLLELVSISYDPDLALSNFERFAEKIYDKNYFYTLLSESNGLLKALVFLFSGSQVLSDTLLSDPSYFDWLKQPETLNKPKSKDALFRDFYVMVKNT